ncbi:MAG: hypothetical protein AB7G39_16505, partial [Alphaproteobacteria bacterium]
RLNASAKPTDGRSGYALYGPHSVPIGNHRRLIERDKRRTIFGANCLDESERLIERHQLRNMQHGGITLLDAYSTDGSGSVYFICPCRIKADANVHACSHS